MTSEFFINIDQERLQKALEASEIGIWEFNPITKAIIWSKKCYDLFGFDTGQLIDLDSFISGLHPDDKERAVQMLDDALHQVNGGHINMEYRIVNARNKLIYWVRATGKAYFNENGQANRLIGILTDITQEKGIQARANEKERLMKDISDSAPVALWITDENGQCFFKNKTWHDWTGLSDGELLGYGWMDAMFPDEKVLLLKNLQNAIATQSFFTADFHLVHKNGNIRWCLANGRPRYTEDGKFIGLAGSCVDITELKNTEEKLRYRTALFEAQNEATADGILIVDAKGKMLSYNNRFVEIWNMPKEITAAKDDYAALEYAMQQLEEPDAFINKVKHLYEHPYTIVEDELYLKNGKVIQRHGRPVTGMDGKNYGWVWYFRDITQVKNEERILHFKTALLEAQQEASPDGILITDGKGKIIMSNSRFAELWNIPKYIIEEKDDEASLLYGMNQTVNPEREIEKVKEVYINPNRIVEDEIHFKSGKILERRARPIIDNNNTYYGWAWYFRDITKQRMVEQTLEQRVTERTQELEAANTSLERSNRELEQFAYIASHDLQEPLRKIRTYIDMMNLDLERDHVEKAKQYIQKINQSSARMNDLIKDLLNFSRLNLSHSDTFEKTDLNTVLKYILEDLELIIVQKRALVQSECLPVINAIPLQMSQLFYNLLNNSLKFSKKDVIPKIEIRSKLLSKDEKAKLPHIDARRNIYEITFKDNGIGFSPEYAEQIFTIFQRLHSRSSYEGTGIGLALCKKIALNHQGDIFAVSEEGMGAEFHVLLPE
ncbi:PAS domain S-box protein [Chitinophagaceae bacterium LB-8]|uniref:histidine kinase n=1 Tax=Paraflavisolibacter caeni TaxID=2982496 RepID=A0A9X3BAG3_9BACT|nr:PAS domain S-box protein [Paraflavisolibacter caeni]MCU7552726.1 PAS domain S-box protein [Paraflavisolibacter caeni]